MESATDEVMRASKAAVSAMPSNRSNRASYAGSLAAHGIETVTRHLTPSEQLWRLHHDTFTLLASTHRHGERSSALLANSLDQSGTHPAEVTVAARTSFVTLARIAGRWHMTASSSMYEPCATARILSKGKQAQIVHAARDWTPASQSFLARYPKLRN